MKPESFLMLEMVGFNYKGYSRTLPSTQCWVYCQAVTNDNSF